MGEEEKYFMWFVRDYYKGDNVVFGPHYNYDEKLIKKNFYHSIDDILKIPNLSDSIRKRIVNSKIGTCIKIHKQHSCGDLMIKRIAKEDLHRLDELVVCCKEHEKCQKKLYTLESEMEKLSSSFF